MTEPPPRKRFQIHLSTAIVMMFVAGALIWANTARPPVEMAGGYRGTERIYTTVAKPYGFPVHAGYGTAHTTPSSWAPVNSTWSTAVEGVSYAAMSINVVIALLVLFAVCFLCEWLIRRRAARKGA